MTNVGLDTGPAMPSPWAIPEVSSVFPVPRRPSSKTTSPGKSTPASRRPSASVSSGDWVRVVIMRASATEEAELFGVGIRSGRCPEVGVVFEGEVTVDSVADEDEVVAHVLQV